MMFEFWLATAILCLVAVMFVLMPVFMARRIENKAAIEDSERRKKANVLIFKERLRELSADLRADVISEEEYQQLKSELELNLLEDADQIEASEEHRATYSLPRSFIVLFVGLSCLMVAAAYVFYDRWGYGDQVQAFQESRFSDDELEKARQAAEQGDTKALLTQLRDKLKSGAGNSEGWGLLARSAMNVQEFDLATEAYRELIKLENSDPKIQAALHGLLAQALYFGGRGVNDVQTQEALSRALDLDANEPNALGLLAIASFENQEWQNAISYWNQILEAYPDHPSKTSITLGISRAKSMLGEPGTPGNEVSARSPEADSSSLGSVTETGVYKESFKGSSKELSDESFENLSNDVSVALTVSIPQEVMDKAGDSAVLYVFAKPSNGSPMPLAVKRFPVNQAEYSVVLSDADAMSPQARLSQHDEVLISAKVSLSGEVAATGGGFESAVLKANLAETDSLQLMVNKPIN